MSGGAIFWMIVFSCSALIFFGVAVVVSVRGWIDLKDLLRLRRKS